MLFISEGNSSFGQIIRRHLYLYLVSRQYLDVVHTHLARNVGYDDVAVVKLYAEHSV